MDASFHLYTRYKRRRCTRKHSSSWRPFILIGFTISAKEFHFDSDTTRLLHYLSNHIRIKDQKKTIRFSAKYGTIPLTRHRKNNNTRGIEYELRNSQTFHANNEWQTHHPPLLIRTYSITNGQKRTMTHNNTTMNAWDWNHRTLSEHANPLSTPKRNKNDCFFFEVEHYYRRFFKEEVLFK